MDTLLFFVLWGAALFVMFRFGCGAHVMGRHGGRPGDAGPQAANDDLRWIAPKRDTDPVCGKTVLTQAAKSSVHDGRVYYFCSRECREVFEAAPDIYAGGDQPDLRRVGHGHG